MEDIAPKLLEKLKRTFRANLEADKRAEKLRKKIEDGAANYEDVGNYAERAGKALARAFDSCLTEDTLPDGRMYWNIAEKVIQPVFEDDYKILSEAAVKVQQQLNTAAKIGLKAQKAEYDTDMVIGVMNKVVAEEKYSVAAYVLRDASNVFSRSVVDSTLKANVEFQGKAGRKPRIIRTPASGCCEWCAGLAGTYSYPNTPKEVYARHNNCNCIVEYDPGTGNSRQNVHTKQWTSGEESAKIEARKNLGPIKSSKHSSNRGEVTKTTGSTSALAQQIANSPKMFGAYTPKGLKASLEQAGYTVEPLSSGNFKGVSFENGGGFKVNFGGDGLLMYHPEERSHHSGEYYKISTGSGGTHRYDRSGKEKN